jgi:invasion protein IalB
MSHAICGFRVLVPADPSNAVQREGLPVRRARIILALVSLCGLAMVPVPASAQSAAPSVQTRALGLFEVWSAWDHGDGANRVCYVAGQPVSSRPTGVRRGEIRVVVSQRPSAKTGHEVSFQAGYPIKTDKAVVAVIDKSRNFELSRRANGVTEMIWTRDPETDKAMVAALRSGKELVINGTSQRGTATTDVFKLDGFARALDAANKACDQR